MTKDGLKWKKAFANNEKQRFKGRYRNRKKYNQDITYTGKKSYN